MPELRYDPHRGEWTLIAPDRRAAAPSYALRKRHACARRPGLPLLPRKRGRNAARGCRHQRRRQRQERARLARALRGEQISCRREQRACARGRRRLFLPQGRGAPRGAHRFAPSHEGPGRFGRSACGRGSAPAAREDSGARRGPRRSLRLRLQESWRAGGRIHPPLTFPDTCPPGRDRRRRAEAGKRGRFLQGAENRAFRSHARCGA